jgi:uncharacterized protein YyaL (SSP411 family)
MSSLKKSGKAILERVSALQPRHWDALSIEWRGAGKAVAPGKDHLEAAIRWLKRAQDETGTGGVSWGYRARASFGTGKPLGWQAAYPETTGYIIETMLRYHDLTGDSDSLARAKKMADWETSIQLENGGIQGGRSDEKPAVANTFVTGQVLFGWVAAYKRFGEQAYLDSACRAADYLVSCLDGNGQFVRGHSQFCSPGAKAYETRTAWALALAGQASGRDSYLAAARAMGRWALTCRQPNGWYRDNALEDADIPLTHTIGYLLEGFLELGFLLDEPDFLNACVESLDHIAPLVEANGYLAGRWRADWTPAADWCCLTGSSQLATVMFKAERIASRPDLRSAAEKLLAFVGSTQILDGRNPALAGGIFGSYPIGGAYGPYCVLNWATKFYADAVMDSQEKEKASLHGTSQGK